MSEFFEPPDGLAFRTLSGAQIDAEGSPGTRGLCSNFCLAFCESLIECGVSTTDEIWALVSRLSEVQPLLGASSAFGETVSAGGPLWYLAAAHEATKDPQEQHKLFLVAGLLAVDAAISALGTEAIDAVADAVAGPMVALALAYAASDPDRLNPPGRLLVSRRHAKMTLIRAKALDLYQHGGPWKSSRQAAKRICSEVREYAHGLRAPLSPDRAERTVYDWILGDLKSSRG